MAYLIAFISYVSIGIFGALGISGRMPKDKIYKKDSIFDMFDSNDVTIYKNI